MFHQPGVSCGRLVWEKVPLFVLVVISSLVTFYSQKAVGTVVSLADIPVIVRISNALVTYVTYLGKIIWLIHLAIYYPHPGNSLPLWEALGAVLILAVISYLIIRRGLCHFP